MTSFSPISFSKTHQILAHLQEIESEPTSQSELLDCSDMALKSIVNCSSFLFPLRGNEKKKEEWKPPLFPVLQEKICNCLRGSQV